MQQRGLPLMRYLLLVSIGISSKKCAVAMGIVASDSLMGD
jgi:hypothetical protein